MLVFPHKFRWTTKYNMLYIDNPVSNEPFLLLACLSTFIADDYFQQCDQELLIYEYFV